MFNEVLFDSICPSVEDGINFIAEPYDSFIFGTHPMVCCLFKGVLELEPSLPVYKNVLDFNTALPYFSSLHPHQDLTLRDLTYKSTCTMLFCFVIWQKCQTLHLLSVSSMVL